MKIFVAGGFDEDNPKVADLTEFCTKLAEEIIVQGHTLLNGCMTLLDNVIASAASNKLREINAPNSEWRVISYALSDREPSHSFGKIIQSKLKNWELGGSGFYVPEPIAESDVIVLICGYEGTYRAANWARINNKPILPITAFGGAAEKIYYDEYDSFDQKYAGRIERFDYQELNVRSNNWTDLAKGVISLAEKVAISSSVVVIMSYSGRNDLEDAYDSFQFVCERFGYKCKRVDDSNTEGRIVPTILEQIKNSAFAIVDLTELKPNVLYELGYAEGLGKKVVLTAKQGTDLPFDVKDVPTIFWDGQKLLKEVLTSKITGIAEKQGRSLQK